MGSFPERVRGLSDKDGQERDRAAVWLLIGYSAVGLALLVTLIGIGPLMPVLLWRAH